MNIHVIYHRADYDGLLSAAVCLHFMPDAIIHPWDYGDPVPVIPTDCDALYIVDLSVPDLMDHPRLIWIDHHKSAIEKWPQASRAGIRVDGVAACRLCWQWFREQPHVGSDAWEPYLYTSRKAYEPFILTLAGEYDVWDLRDKRALWLQHGLATFSHDPRELSKLLDEQQCRNIGYADGGCQEAVEHLVKRGETIEDFIQKDNAKVLTERSYILEWEGLTFLVLNTAKGNSRSFPRIDKVWRCSDGHPAQPVMVDVTWEDIDALMMWRFDGHKVIVSLYHKTGREDLDLSQIAVRYGGGGHRGACGFQAELEWVAENIA